MCENSGFCGSIIRFLLITINVIFFILGAVVFTIAGILQWSDGSIFNKLSEETDGHIDLTVLSDISITLLILGGAIILVSIIGLIGSCCANRFFLIIYEIVLILLFIAHLVIVIIVAVESPAIEKEFKKQLNETVEEVKAAQPSEYEAKCKDLKVIGDVFKCCGYNGISDFPIGARQFCCDPKETNLPGCAEKVVGDIKGNAVDYLIIPNAIVLAAELIFIIAVPFLIGRLSKKKKQEKYTPTYTGNKNVTFQYNM